MKKGLGEKMLGVDVLLQQRMEQLQTEKEQIQQLDIHEIAPNRNQPRKQFDTASLEELAASIKEYGILQPIVVKEIEKGYYEIVAGERRWRAAKLAGLHIIPAIVREFTPSTGFEVALVENLQREDLNPMEEARSYQRLQEEFGYTQSQIAEKLGKSRPVIANALRLLQLDARVQQYVLEQKISAGHARALSTIPQKQQQCDLAERIFQEGWSVRQIEEYMRQQQQSQHNEPKQRQKTIKDTLWCQVEQELQNLLSTKVRIQRKKNNKGKIEIEYYSEEDLDRLLVLLHHLEQYQS